MKLKLRNLSKRYGTHQVLDRLSLELNDVHSLVVIGPSGGGKTTLLRILAGLDADFRGHVSRPPDARLGMVFQEPRLLPWRSVEDNVRLAAPNADETRLSALFSILELNAHRSHFPGELSLGLAPIVVKELMERLRLICRELGLTVLLVEQNAKAALTISDYGYVMESGRVVFYGKAAELMNHPDVRELYLGGAGQIESKTYRDIKQYRRKRRWWS